MKAFNVDVNITMSCCIEVAAENEEEAKNIVANWIGDDAWNYVRNGDYVGHEFVGVNETEPDESNIGRAVEYIRENMEGYELDGLMADMEECYASHLIPNENVMDCDRVIELLDEFGEENDLGERWWEDECDLDEILTKL